MENFPLDVGDSFVFEDGEEFTFIDIPTDGPLFVRDDGVELQLTHEEFERQYLSAVFMDERRFEVSSKMGGKFVCAYLEGPAEGFRVDVESFYAMIESGTFRRVQQ